MKAKTGVDSAKAYARGLLVDKIARHGLGWDAASQEVAGAVRQYVLSDARTPVKLAQLVPGVVAPICATIEAVGESYPQRTDDLEVHLRIGDISGSFSCYLYLPSKDDQTGWRYVEKVVCGSWLNASGAWLRISKTSDSLLCDREGRPVICVGSKRPFAFLPSCTRCEAAPVTSSNSTVCEKCRNRFRVRGPLR
ncbi:MAG: hypothetical protein ACYDDF_14905 [Thermoplasmatota archaeon]